MVRIKLYFPSHISPTKKEVQRWNTKHSSSKLTYQKLLEKIRSCSSSRRQQYFISWFDGKDYCTIRDDETLWDALKALKDRHGNWRHLPIYVTYDSRLASTIYGVVPQAETNLIQNKSSDDDNDDDGYVGDYFVPRLELSQEPADKTKDVQEVATQRPSHVAQPDANSKEDSSDSSDDSDSDSDGVEQTEEEGKQNEAEKTEPVCPVPPACVMVPGDYGYAPIPLYVPAYMPVMTVPTQPVMANESNIQFICNAVQQMGIRATDEKICDGVKQSDGTM